jgi:hypothetical protein
LCDFLQVTQGLIDARRCAVKAGNPAFGEVYKTLSNSYVGKTLQDPVRYSTKVEELSYDQLQRIVELQGKATYRRRVSYVDSCIIECGKTTVTSRQTLWGCFVYSMAKLMMREFCDLLNAYFGPTGWRFLYTDTDSLLMSVYEHDDGPTLSGFMRDHADWLNLAGYPVWHSLYDPKYPKRCCPTDDSVGHGTLDLEDVGIPSKLGFCNHHLQEQQDCHECMEPAEKPCAKHKWSNTCSDCKANADKWKDVPSMCFDLRADGPKLYRVRVVEDVLGYDSHEYKSLQRKGVVRGNETVGTWIEKDGQVIAIVGKDGLVKLKSKLKAKGVGCKDGTNQAKNVFSVKGEAELDSGKGVAVEFERIGQQRHKDGVNPNSMNLLSVKKRVGCSGITGGKGKRRKVACTKHEEYVESCPYCFVHETPYV